MSDPKIPTVTDFPALYAWLEKRDATFLWSALSDSRHALIQAWRVNGLVAMVLLYTNVPAWDIFTAAQSAACDKTLADADQRLGVKS